MGCFDNLIAIKGTCSDATPTSGLYLDMFGFKLGKADDMIQEDYASGEALVSDMMTLAKEIMVNQVTTHFADKFRTNSVIEGQRVGYYYDNLTAVAGTANYLGGMRLELCNDRNFFDIFISELSLQTNFTGNISVLVYDLIQNKLLDTLTVATVAGEVSTTYVNKRYKSTRKKLHLFLGYDMSAVNSYQSTVGKNGCASCGGGGITYLNQYLSATGAKVAIASSKILDNVENIGNTAGMSLNYALECNHEEWLCTISNLLALPLAYKTLSELYSYGMKTQRSNDTTLFEQFEKEMEDAEFRYREALDNVLKKIKLPSDNICFQCNDKSRHAIILP